MVPIASAAWKSSGIIVGRCSANAFASAGSFKGKPRVKWLWLVTRSPSSPSLVLPLCARPLFEHLLDCLRYHLRVFVAIVAQCILSKPAPDQGLVLGVVQVDNHCPYHVLFWGDSAHSAADSAHAPGLVGGLLFHATACCEDQIRRLGFL